MTIEPHNQKGHLNIYVLDQNAVYTGYGKHSRVLAFQPDSEGMYCRVDIKHNLPEPSLGQIKKVAKEHQGIKGVWELVSKEYYNNSTTIDYNFKRII